MKEAKLQGVNTREGLGLLAAVLRQGHPRARRGRPKASTCGRSFLPFDETKTNKMLRQLREVHRQGQGRRLRRSRRGRPASCCVTSSTTIAEAGGNNARHPRRRCSKAADDITDFDADGMLGHDQRRASSIPSACFVLIQVKGGKFVRVFPKKAGTFQLRRRRTSTRSSSTSSSHTIGSRPHGRASRDVEQIATRRAVAERLAATSSTFAVVVAS